MSDASQSLPSLDRLADAQTAVVQALLPPEGSAVDEALLGRLAELGFLPGEVLTVLRRGPGGREPIAVQIGDTVFALRAVEAACVRVQAAVAA